MVFIQQLASKLRQMSSLFLLDVYDFSLHWFNDSTYVLTNCSTTMSNPIQNIFCFIFSIRFNRMFVNRPHRKRETGRQIQPFKLRQDQCDHIWWNFATPAKKLKVFCNFFDGVFSTEQNYEHTLANFLGMLWSKNSLLETAKY